MFAIKVAINVMPVGCIALICWLKFGSSFAMRKIPGLNVRNDCPWVRNPDDPRHKRQRCGGSINIPGWHLITSISQQKRRRIHCVQHVTCTWKVHGESDYGDVTATELGCIGGLRDEYSEAKSMLKHGVMSFRVDQCISIVSLAQEPFAGFPFEFHDTQVRHEWFRYNLLGPDDRSRLDAVRLPPPHTDIGSFSVTTVWSSVCCNFTKLWRTSFG